MKIHPLTQGYQSILVLANYMHKNKMLLGINNCTH